MDIVQSNVTIIMISIDPGYSIFAWFGLWALVIKFMDQFESLTVRKIHIFVLIEVNSFHST